ncbi:hypothetical protein BC826DRAFT_976621 [Russula brevipes]|nr:hypothetical protein BC826DRAFT_976621 [Russula brevipes]
MGRLRSGLAIKGKKNRTGPDFQALVKGGSKELAESGCAAVHLVVVIDNPNLLVTGGDEKDEARGTHGRAATLGTASGGVRGPRGASQSPETAKPRDREPSAETSERVVPMVPNQGSWIRRKSAVEEWRRACDLSLPRRTLTEAKAKGWGAISVRLLVKE